MLQEAGNPRRKHVLRNVSFFPTYSHNLQDFAIILHNMNLTDITYVSGPKSVSCGIGKVPANLCVLQSKVIFMLSVELLKFIKLVKTNIEALHYHKVKYK